MSENSECVSLARKTEINGVVYNTVSHFHPSGSLTELLKTITTNMLRDGDCTIDSCGMLC